MLVAGNFRGSENFKAIFSNYYGGCVYCRVRWSKFVGKIFVLRDSISSFVPPKITPYSVLSE